MGLSFINSALLGALSLVSIPIIIHLLQRRLLLLRQSQRQLLTRSTLLQVSLQLQAHHL